MDSRLLAGAYSQHYRALEKETLDETDRMNSITRAKRLTLETNKRRKSQAHKRKLEAQKEERRRQEILIKRREEQKQATEKYQRAHIPPSARQSSGRFSPRRHGGPVLEDALRLIRNSPRHIRPYSSHERSRIQSPRKENEDPLERSYFDQHRYQAGRPASAKNAHQINSNTRAELMDFSMQNLTSSKTLFEQQLEQQQNLLYEQQQQSLREFNSAIRQEIQEETQKDDVESDIPSSGSCSSLDSLEQTQGRKELREQMTRNSIETMEKAQEGSENLAMNQNFGQMPISSTHLSSTPMNQDLTAAATFKINETFQNSLQNVNASPANHPSFVGLTREDILTSESNRNNTDIQRHLAHQSPLKQISTDSLESMSSSSTIQEDKVRTENRYQSPQKQRDAKQGSASDVGNISPTQMAWISPFPQPASTTMPLQTPSPSNIRPESGDIYNPRYASAIGTSIWPGHGIQRNTQTTKSDSSTRNILTSSTASTPYSDPAPPKSDSNSVAQSALKSDSVLKSGVIGSNFSFAPSTISTNNFNVGLDNARNTNFDIGASKMQDVCYNDAFNNVSLGTETANKNNLMDNGYTPFVPTYTGNYSIASQSGSPSSQATYSSSLNTAQTYSIGSPIVAQKPPPRPTASPYSMQQQLQHQRLQEQQTPQTSSQRQQLQLSGMTTQQLLQQFQNQTPQPTGPPVPAVRTIFPTSRPPLPTTAAAVSSKAEATAQETKAVQFAGLEPSTVSSVIKIEETIPSGVAETEEVLDEDLEESPPLKGILKQIPASPQPAKNSAKGNNAGQVHPRDSLELARFHSEKKAKKKSVRFAENHTEQTLQEEDETDYHSASVASKPLLNRPSSAKVLSTTPKLDSNRPPRAASAGIIRQHNTNNPSAQLQIRNVQQMAPPAPSATNGVTFENDNDGIVYGTSRSNLPQSYSAPLSTTTPINRPKAAAHIIMSAESHAAQKTSPSVATVNSPRPPSPTASNPAVAATAHKSQFDTKVKTINGNFMSKVPIKIPTNGNGSNVIVYHAAITNEKGDQISPSTNEYTKTPSSKSTETNNQQQSGIDRNRIRDQTSKRVPISNSTVTRTSIVPASTKISMPSSASGVPSYSTTSGNNNNSSGVEDTPVYDENGLRIDRTPTDEEITWLWNKVRNCLNKEEGSTPGSGPKAGEPRQPPTLSTKLIDGASLGFGTSGTNGMTGGLRTGAGFFHPRPAGNNNTTAQNKAKPALQQPGSYLARYGLLKQRRATSATGTGPAKSATQTQPRASSAVYGRHPTLHIHQQPDEDGPSSLAQAYKAQDNVSESTAAFMVAERLAKQSLTDSYTHAAMEDAKAKQEAHNKSRMNVTRGNTALSIEEQRLLESLDKLNDRLRVADTKYTGTIHYHQPYQAHLPGFRGHTPVVDNRRNNTLSSPRGQQRALSARIRQQTRQYR